MKKSFVYVLCALLILTFAACGKAEAEPDNPATAHRYPKSTIYNGYDFYDSVELGIGAAEYLSIANARYGEVSEEYTSPCYERKTEGISDTPLPDTEAKLILTRLYNEADDANTYISALFLNDKLCSLNADSMVGAASEEVFKNKAENIIAAQEYPRRDMKRNSSLGEEWSGRDWTMEQPYGTILRSFSCQIVLPDEKAEKWAGVSDDANTLGAVYKLGTYQAGEVGLVQTNYSDTPTLTAMPYYSFEVWRENDYLIGLVD